MQHLNGLHTIASQYDGFIFDQWGVLHDGIEAAPGALPTLEKLQSLKKKIYVLSNSSRTAAESINKLADLGLPSTLFDFVVTSGEVLKRELSDNNGFVQKLGSNCFVIGSPNPILFEKSEVKTTSLNNANFIVLLGVPPDQDAITKVMPTLKTARKRNLPMLCANSDFYYPHGNDIFPGSGQAAQAYESMGGKVIHFCKPYKIAYDAVLNVTQIPHNRLVMIGDSLEHDIKGAHDAGIDSVLITSGIHKNDLPSKNSTGNTEAIAALCQRHNLVPTWALHKLAWD